MLKEEKAIRSHHTNYHKIIFGFLILSFLFDFIDKIETFYRIDFIKFNRYLKLIFIVLSTFFILSKLKYLLRELKIIFFLLLAIGAVFLLKNNYTSLYMDEFLRYSFGLLIYPLFFYTYYKTETSLDQQLYALFKVLICVNAIAILAGFAFNLAVMQTYQYGRFGYNGILLSQGFTPYVYLCATTLFLVFKDKKMLGLILILSVVSGIKGVYFSQFLLVTLYILFEKGYSGKKKIIVISLALVSFISFLGILFMSPVFKEILDSDGVLSMIFSFRNENLMEVIEKINTSNYNAFIGAINLDVVRIEMQFFDVILFLGIIGLLVYILFIHQLFTKIARTKTSKIYLIVVLTLSLLSGNLFYIPMAMVLLFLVLFAFRNDILNTVKQ